jgi:hypothetical protein
VTGLGEEGARSSTWCRALAPPSSPPVPLPPALPSRYAVKRLAKPPILIFI